MSWRHPMAIRGLLLIATLVASAALMVAASETSRSREGLSANRPWTSAEPSVDERGTA